MSPKNRLCVLVVDDHPVVRAGLMAMIEQQPDLTVVAQAATGTEAVELWRQYQPDVTLMDLRLPEMDGLEAMRVILQEFPQACIIVLTASDGDEDIYRGLEAGAKAYLLKGTPRAELLDCIRRVHRGETCLPSPIAAKLTAHLSREALTPRELEVLQMMARGQSNRHIASTLGITRSTVKFHIRHVLAKLSVHSRSEAVAVASQRGLVRMT